MIQTGHWALFLALSLSLAGKKHASPFLLPFHKVVLKMAAMRTYKHIMARAVVCLRRACCSRLEVPGSTARVPAHLSGK